jgi:hypothetical protein
VVVEAVELANLDTSLQVMALLVKDILEVPVQPITLVAVAVVPLLQELPVVE